MMDTQQLVPAVLKTVLAEWTKNIKRDHPSDIIEYSARWLCADIISDLYN